LLLGASLVPGFGGKWEFLVEKNRQEIFLHQQEHPQKNIDVVIIKSDRKAGMIFIGVLDGCNILII